MIFQDLMTALNPLMTVGNQSLEVIQLHNPELKPGNAVTASGVVFSYDLYMEYRIFLDFIQRMPYNIYASAIGGQLYIGFTVKCC